MKSEKTITPVPTSEAGVPDRYQDFNPAIPEGVEDTKFSLRELSHPLSKYTPEQKIAAVAAYHYEGSADKAAALSGVNANTIRWWKSEATWWAGALAQCQKDTDDYLTATMQDVVQSAVLGVQTAVKEGEERRDKDGEIRKDKEGNVIKFKPTARDMAWMAAVFQDKLNLLKGRPTSISARSQTDVLQELGNKLAQMSDEIREKNKTDPTIVSEQ